MDPRTLWEAVERYHQSCYHAPEVREAATAVGLKGFWMNYFATRAAPMGPVRAEVVESLFFYFAPHRVRRAIPDAWGFATPEEILRARFDGVRSSLHRQLGGAHDTEVEAALAVVRAAVAAADTTGRPLAAAWRAIPEPDDSRTALWHGCTVLRELRSGNHLTALVAAGLDGCESIISHVAVDEAQIAWIEAEAGWTAADASAAADRLRRRDWIDERSAATERGRRGRADIETMTDELDRPHWEQVGEDACVTLLAAMKALNADLPRDDQLDWQEIYGPNER